MRTILIIVAVILVGGLLFSAYYGAFCPVEIREESIGPLIMAGEKMIGPYKNSSEVMDKIYYGLLDNEKVETYKGFGLYYDNPAEVNESELRSFVGCLIEEKDNDKIDALREKYNIRILPKSKCVVAEFPFRGMMSVFMGIFRVYPKLAEYLAEKDYGKVPVMEMYDMPNETITYIAPVHMEPERFNSYLKDNKAEFLRDYEGKKVTDIPLCAHPYIQARIETLLGDDLAQFEENFEMPSPISYENGIVFVTGLRKGEEGKPPAGASVFMIDLGQDIINARLFEGKEVKEYNEKDTVLQYPSAVTKFMISVNEFAKIMTNTQKKSKKTIM